MAFLTLFPLLIYLAFFGLIIWFIITLINVQKERNSILKGILSKLNDLEIKKKEE